MENETVLIKKGGNVECPNCSAVMKLVPAGVSKKNNKPYNAFYSCPECKNTVNPEPSATPKLTLKPPQKNGDSLGMMRLAYRKDLMVAVLNQLGETATDQSIKDLFDSLWIEVEK